MVALRADRLLNDERILRAAARQLGADPAATMQAIADEAGVARPTVYRRYPDRDALITELRAQVEREVRLALDDLPPWTAGTDTMTALIEVLAEVAVRYPLGLLRYAPVSGSPALLDARVAGILALGQQAGNLRIDISPETMHACLFGVLSAVVDQRVMSAADETPHEAVAKIAAADIVSLLMPGLTARKGVT